MTTEKVSGTVSTVLGEVLETPIAFEVTYEAFSNVDEAKAAGEWPNDGAILKMVNTKLQNNARQAETARLTAEKKAEIEETPAYKRKELIKNILASKGKGFSQAKAEAMADSILAAN